MALAVGLALGAAHGDSITVDEPIHLMAGLAALQHGDFRLSPEHPPLARMWAALPLLLMRPRWPPADDPGWQAPDYFGLARDWLSRWNDGGRLIAPARAMMAALLAGLCLATAAVARRLLGGAAAGLALFVAALDPTLLAHGHYVTTDLPMALAALLALLACSRLLAAPTPARLALAALALAAASLVKFSWLLLLPAMAPAAILAVCMPRLAPGLPAGLPARAGVAGSLALSLLAAVALAIWAAYGFAYRPPPAAGHAQASANALNSAHALNPGNAVNARTVANAANAWNAGNAGAAGIAAPHLPAVPGPRAAGAGLPSTPEQRWEAVLSDPVDGRRFAGLPRLIAFARDHRLLPEPYLYGMAYAYRKSRYRSAYLLGRYSTTGWRWYFPLAFAVKTPLPTLLLLAAGLAAILKSRKAGAGAASGTGGTGGTGGSPVHAEAGAAPMDAGAGSGRAGAVKGTSDAGGGARSLVPGDGLLAASLVAFVAVYGGAAIASHLDIGQRHLLPLYPAVFIGAGGAAAWLHGRGRLLVLALCLWLLAGTLLAYPSYLGYFNELAGGARHGHLVLSDSNVDWVQDLLRLADYAGRRPAEPIKLAQSGGVPLPRGFSPGLLLEAPPGTPLTALAAGTYAVSSTELAGVYQPLIRDESWRRPEVRQAYGRLAAAAGRGQLAPGSPAARRFDFLRRARLLNRLRHRPPDGRAGTSLFLFRLGAADVAALTRP